MYRIINLAPGRDPWEQIVPNAEQLILKLLAYDVDTAHMPPRGGLYWGNVEFESGTRVEWGAVRDQLPTAAHIRAALRPFIAEPVRLNVSWWTIDDRGDARVTVTTVNSAHAIQDALWRRDTYFAQYLTRILGRHFLLESAEAGRSLAHLTFVIPAAQGEAFAAIV